MHLTLIAKETPKAQAQCQLNGRCRKLFSLIEWLHFIKKKSKNLEDKTIFYKFAGALGTTPYTKSDKMRFAA